MTQSSVGRSARKPAPRVDARSRKAPTSDESEVNCYLGRRVFERRRSLGLTQRELGRAIGVGFQQVHKYETGASRMTPERLLALANALGVSVSYFFEGFNPSSWAAETAQGERA
jgi:ribosome-binding protein aMBF1 (putative translation factor)